MQTDTSQIYQGYIYIRVTGEIRGNDALKSRETPKTVSTSLLRGNTL